MARTSDEPWRSYAYAACYCEENIWHLALRRRHMGRDAGAVVLISNAGRSVALGAQRTGRGESRVTVWDYHVVYVEAGEVYDLDTTLPLPVPAQVYVDATFPTAFSGPESPYRPGFSVLTAARYLEAFSSDRAHMRDAAGRYLAPPPPWPPIYRPELGNTLFALVDGAHEAVCYTGSRFPLEPDDLLHP